MRLLFCVPTPDFAMNVPGGHQLHYKTPTKKTRTITARLTYTIVQENRVKDSLPVASEIHDGARNVRRDTAHVRGDGTTRISRICLGLSPTRNNVDEETLSVPIARTRRLAYFTQRIAVTRWGWSLRHQLGYTREKNYNTIIQYVPGTTRTRTRSCTRTRIYSYVYSYLYSCS